VDDERLFRVVEPGELLHRRMQAEEVVEAARRTGTVPAQRQLAVKIGVIGIADRGGRAKPVQRAAQDDDDQPRISRRRGARPSRNRREGEGRSGGAQKRAAADHRRTERHRHLL